MCSGMNHKRINEIRYSKEDLKKLIRGHSMDDLSNKSELTSFEVNGGEKKK